MRNMSSNVSQYMSLIRQVLLCLKKSSSRIAVIINAISSKERCLSKELSKSKSLKDTLYFV